MARLSKADWNKLKSSIGHYKGTLQKGVKWTVGKERKSWTRKIAKATNSQADGGVDAS